MLRDADEMPLVEFKDRRTLCPRYLVSAKVNSMNATVADEGRREFLIKGTATLAVAGLATTAVPFLASWRPTTATALAGLPVQIDLTKIQMGEGIKFLWRGSPMWVIRRDPASIAQLDGLRNRLKDPDSLASQQPNYAKNSIRARRADVMVFTAVCTHFGCIPELKHASDGELDADLHSGFVCPCHGSRFDAAGRVIKGSPASDNLPVPSYYFESDDMLVIGADGPEAKS
ncbi:MAG TPA: ubiquinol-cytochrome c reductase iron-sulfur subunit [Steroidobacteraceae bacterium]|nr:ubiquinol-cytochrome c reductase iron-sulfur subunit [Steroidobacteraceae bacterium]